MTAHSTAPVGFASGGQLSIAHLTHEVREEGKIVEAAVNMNQHTCCAALPPIEYYPSGSVASEDELKYTR